MIPLMGVGADSVEFQVLGRFVVRRGGREEVPAADFGGRKVRTLLRILLSRRGTFVSHDALTEMIWADRPPRDAVANLQVLVNRARRAIGRPDIVQTGAGGYALAGGAECTVDAEQFVAAVARSREPGDAERLTVVQEALQLWRGEPFAEDAYADWAADYRDRLMRHHLEALETGAAVALTLHDPIAFDYAASAVAQDPLREHANVLLIRAFIAGADPAGALAHYERFRRILADELGVDPSAEAQALHTALVRGELTTKSASRAARPRARQVVFRQLPFVGRDDELAKLIAAHDRGGVAWVEGLSGSGKSRLLAELAATTGGVTVKAMLADRNEPWSLVRSLVAELLAQDVQVADGLATPLRTALSSLVPHLLPTAATAVRGETRRALLVEAVLRLLTLAGPPALYVDDLQWADASSLAVIRRISDRVPGLPLVLACRAEDGGPGSLLADVATDLNPWVRIDVPRLPLEAVQALVADAELTRALTSHTDRTPMAVTETLRELAADGVVVVDNHGRWVPLDAHGAAIRAEEIASRGQRQVIARRLDRTEGVSRAVVNVLALLRRAAPAALLAAATGFDEVAVLDALDALSRNALVRLDEAGWSTTHDMVSEVAEQQLPDAERSRCHALTATVLESIGEHGEAAKHWAGAGESDRAAAEYLNAASRALDRFAHDEALTLAAHGLQVVREPSVRASLHVVRARARVRVGAISDGRSDYRDALAFHRSGTERATLLAELATVASGADDLVRASELVELALVEARDDTSARAAALEVASMIDMNLDRAQRAEERAEEAIQLYQQLGRADGVARVLDVQAMATFINGDIRRGTEQLHRVANLFEDSGELLRVITPRSTRGHGLVFLARPAEGLADIDAALELAQTLGNREGQTYSLWHRTEALAALGHGDQALTAAREALDIASAIGHRGWTATGYRALGIAQQTTGNWDDALASYRASLEAAEHLDLFASWALARIAMTLVVQGQLEDAAKAAEAALGRGPGLAHHEARLARVEVSAARDDPAAVLLAREAARIAERDGALNTLSRLREFADP
jgi:DNA-binding SARP family transcriptional activator/tetratricopeptide (TPR) repeat protein